MQKSVLRLIGNKAVLNNRERMCETAEELLESEKFRLVLDHCLDHLRSRKSPMMNIFHNGVSKRPYRTFNETIEHLTHLIRTIYRHIQENITGSHPNVYRQVTAGAEMAVISLPKNIPYLDERYEKLNHIPVIRQVLLYPPLVIQQPMNKRTGHFKRIVQNPVDLVQFNYDDWLCYPIKAGKLLILVYFHLTFLELGLSMCNLFQMATDADLEKKPDAVFIYGVQENVLDGLSEYTTVFCEDEANSIFVGAVPGNPEFGYFGYLKKMILTLHNSIVMKTGKMPFHGAMVKIMLQEDKEATVLMIGDTGAGKSETLEAFRVLGDKLIRELIIIADDMGSIELDAKGFPVGYGTETGAFLRLDDLQPGYAFGHLDRSIIMNPSQVNSRIVLPVTSYENVIKGHRIDYVLYANNYEQVDSAHPAIEKFSSADEALEIFRTGAVMSKGTTTASGLVNSYFANIFGPPEYRELHEEITGKYFESFFRNNVFVGQMRTRLGIPGYATSGPKEAATELLKIISA
jgi:hypothetical protein